MNFLCTQVLVNPTKARRRQIRTYHKQLLAAEREKAAEGLAACLPLIGGCASSSTVFGPYMPGGGGSGSGSSGAYGTRGSPNIPALYPQGPPRGMTAVPAASLMQMAVSDASLRPW